MRTIVSEVDHMTSEQNHQGIKEVEAVGCGRVDRGTNGNSTFHETLDDTHDLLN